MRIQKLTSSELEKIQNDIDDLTQLVADYTRILNNPSEIQEIIKTELIDLKLILSQSINNAILFSI